MCRMKTRHECHMQACEGHVKSYGKHGLGYAGGWQHMQAYTKDAQSASAVNQEGDRKGEYKNIYASVSSMGLFHLHCTAGTNGAKTSS